MATFDVRTEGESIDCIIVTDNITVIPTIIYISSPMPNKNGVALMTPTAKISLSSDQELKDLINALIKVQELDWFNSPPKIKKK